MKFDRSKTKVYIAGCGGMLGQAVYRTFDSVAKVKATDIDVNEDWLEYADVRDYDSLRESVVSFSPDIIINLAALTDMEECEANAEDAWLTNALGAENMGLLANELQVPLVYISTAGIFDGAQDEYNDFDRPNPLSIYAKSKFSGEVFVREHVNKYFVVRAGWMMGGGPHKDKKFINKIFRQIVGGAKVLRVVDDKLGTPTYTNDFAKGLLTIAESDLYGVYNQVCDGNSSRYEVAQKFVELLNLSDAVKVVRVKSDYFRNEYFAPRPASEMLLTLKLNARKLNVMQEWRVALAEYTLEYNAYLEEIGFVLDSEASATIYAAEEPIRIRLVAEAPTPHNNYLFYKISQNPLVSLEANYLYSPTTVPGRPWKELNADSIEAGATRFGISGIFDWKVISAVATDTNSTNFIIGWNSPLFIFLLTIIGLRKAPLLTWFDTPQESERGRYHPKSLVKRWAIRMINRAPGTVFVTGRLAEEKMRNMGILSTKLQILPFFVPDPIVSNRAEGQDGLRDKLGWKADQGILVVAAGRMIESKGFDILLRAFAIARTNSKQTLRLAIVGAGPELEALQLLSKQLEINSHLVFCPWLEEDEFSQIFSLASIFVAPARFDPFPTTIISAMKAGTAIIASDGVGSALELIESGNNGVIVSKESVQELADGIYSLAESTELRSQLGRKALESIAKWPVEQGVCEVLHAAERA